MSRARVVAVFTIISSFISSTAHSQNCLTDSGTYYIIKITTMRDKPGDWPVSVMAIVKDAYKLNVSKASLHTFVHSVFQQCSYCLDDEHFLLSNLKRCDSAISKAERISRLVDFENKNKALWDSNFRLGFRLKNHTQISINIEKFRGVCWLLPTTQDGINQVSESIHLRMKDHPKHYYFVVKKIDHATELAEDEKNLFRSVFN
jgi:hypothetical protein